MGSYIAVDVARELNLKYLDREILETVAEEAGISAEQVEVFEVRSVRLARLLNLLGARARLPTMPSASVREQEDIEGRVERFGELEGLSPGAARARLDSVGGLAYSPRADYLELVTSAILEFSVRGQVMIVGRGGQMILRGHPGVVHVRVGARFETRVFNLIQREGIKWREAAHRVRRADEHRADYMRRFYNVDWLDSGLYDLVINTDQIPPAAAAQMIVAAAMAVDKAVAEGSASA